MMYREDGTQLSPCICSKVRHALGLKQTPANNDKRCSLLYWTEVCERMGNACHLEVETINNAIALFHQYIN